MVAWLVSGWTVPSRHAQYRCSRGIGQSCRKLQVRVTELPFSASRPWGAGGAGVMGFQWPGGVPGGEAACSWALRPSHGEGALAWGSVFV